MIALVCKFLLHVNTLVQLWLDKSFTPSPLSTDRHTDMLLAILTTIAKENKPKSVPNTQW